jgi:serine/threonine-protein kinase
MDAHVDSNPAAEPPDPVRARSRRRLGRVLCRKWRLDALLGVGGMAAVYAATHRNGSRVAVKILHPELLANAQARTRFLREGYVANAVGHEGAVRVLDDDTAEDGSLFLVTELLEGETLERRRRREGRLSEDDVLCIADQLLEVLAAAHTRGIVHRDLKPENVLVTRAGRVKVLDFGIARLRELSRASRATKSDATLGTPPYMPPEQARGLWDEVDGRADLWAVGANMFYLLTGREVHKGRTTNELLLSAMTAPAERVESVLPTIDPAVAQVVDRALAFERDERWPDAGAMREAVRRAYYDRNGTTMPDSIPGSALAPPCEGSPGAEAPAHREEADSRIDDVPSGRRSTSTPRSRALRLTPPTGRRRRRWRIGGRGRPLARGVVAALVMCGAAALAAVVLVGRASVGRSTLATAPVAVTRNSATLATAAGTREDRGRETAHRPVPHAWEPAAMATTASPATGVTPPSSPFPVPEVAATDLPSAPRVPPALLSQPSAKPATSTAATALATGPSPDPSSVAGDPSPAQPFAPAPAASPACDIPYVLDGTRIHFRPECL